MFKQAEVNVKFDLPKADFADFLAQKQQELTQLANRLGADQARFSQEFADGVDRFTQEFTDFANNTADSTQNFQEDAANLQDAHAKHRAESNQIESFNQTYRQQTSNINAFQEDFNEDSQRIGGFAESYRKESGNIRESQANFVEDRHNLAELQRDFVEDRVQNEKQQSQFVEDGDNIAAFRANFATDQLELDVRRANDLEHVNEVGKRLENFVEEKNTLFGFNEKYNAELKELSNFREAFDQNVDNFERLQQNAQQQAETLASQASQQAKPPQVGASQTQNNVPPEAKLFAGQYTSPEASTTRADLSLKPIAPKQAEPSSLQQTSKQSAALPNGDASSVRVQPEIPQKTSNIKPSQPTETTSSSTTRAPLPATATQPFNTSLPARSIPQSTNDSLEKPVATSIEPLLPQSTSSRPTPSDTKPADQTDVFQLAGLMTGNLAAGANAQASVARSDIAAVNAGQAGGLKSGFSFLSLSEKQRQSEETSW